MSNNILSITEQSEQFEQSEQSEQTQKYTLEKEINQSYLLQSEVYTKDVFTRIKLIFNIVTGFTMFQQNPHFHIDSLDSEYQFILILRNILENYNNNDNSSETVISIKEDMLIKVIVLKYCVIRICKKNIYNTIYSDIYKNISKLNHCNLEYIYNYIIGDNYVFIVSKTIIPLVINNNLNQLVKVDFDELYNQMTSLSYDLNMYNMAHNDIRLDNIGYDSDLNKYILFDFDKFKINTTNYNNNNIYNLFKSISYYKNL